MARARGPGRALRRGGGAGAATRRVEAFECRGHWLPTTPKHAILAVLSDLKGSLKGDIDIDVEVDVDIHRYVGSLKGSSKSVQVLLNGIAAACY